MAEELLDCYNKGCGQKFNPKENTDESCRYHPGGPIFHDALKGWSCCKKRTTDFSEFLSIPGCTKGPHSNVKPTPPDNKTVLTADSCSEKTGDMTTSPLIGEVILKPVTPTVRPSASEPMKRLSVTVADSLKQALEVQMKQLSIDIQQQITTGVGQVQKGTACQNKSCTAVYEGEHSNSETCHYHPGVPIFHEGMKFWSCCERKTTDFNAFLAQQGCTDGRHVWIKNEEEGEGEKIVACRYDYHQTGSLVTLSIFSKLTQPTKSWVEVNKVMLKVNIVFDGGKSHFEKTFTLNGTIDPDKSNVKMMATKVEINLKKLEPHTWASLELPHNKPSSSHQTIS